MADPITPEEIARLREMQTQRQMDRDYLMGTAQHDNYTDRARARDRLFKTGGDLLDALPRLLDEIERLRAAELLEHRRRAERVRCADAEHLEHVKANQAYLEGWEEHFD